MSNYNNTLYCSQCFTVKKHDSKKLFGVSQLPSPTTWKFWFLEGRFACWKRYSGIINQLGITYEENIRNIDYTKRSPNSGGRTVSLFPWMWSSLSRVSSPSSLGRDIKSFSRNTSYKNQGKSYNWLFTSLKTISFLRADKSVPLLVPWQGR